MEKFKSLDEIPLAMNANDLAKALGVSIKPHISLFILRGFRQ